MVINEGIKRNGYYHINTSNCTLDTEQTISTLIQQGIDQRDLYKIEMRDNDGKEVYKKK